jgi:hypothetical protein
MAPAPPGASTTAAFSDAAAPTAATTPNPLLTNGSFICACFVGCLLTYVNCAFLIYMSNFMVSTGKNFVFFTLYNQEIDTVKLFTPIGFWNTRKPETIG